MIYSDMHNFITTYIGFVLGIVMIILPLPLLTGKIPRNLWYGVRIPKAFASDENWKRINIYGAKVLIGWGILEVISTSFLLLFVKVYRDGDSVHALLPIIFLVCAIIQILIFSSKLK